MRVRLRYQHTIARSPAEAARELRERYGQRALGVVRYRRMNAKLESTEEFYAIVESILEETE